MVESGDEKKSMSFPIVSGINMETEDETMSRPMASVSGLLSGRASSTSLRRDAEVEPSEFEVKRRVRKPGLDTGGVGGLDVDGVATSFSSLATASAGSDAWSCRVGAVEVDLCRRAATLERMGDKWVAE